MGRVWIAAAFAVVSFCPQKPGTWYAASAGGGVWLTTESGAHWAPLSDGWPRLDITNITLDPRNGNNVFVTGQRIAGVLRSTDGWSWQNVGTNMGNGVIKVVFRSRQLGQRP